MQHDSGIANDLTDLAGLRVRFLVSRDGWLDRSPHPEVHERLRSRRPSSGWHRRRRKDQG
jgi:hypothetical protein